MNHPTQPARACPRLLRRAGGLALITYAVWLAACCALETRLVYPREMTGPPIRDALIPPDVERVWVDAPGGVRVEAWFLPSRSVRPSPCVVFFHGNAELIDHNFALAQRYRERGLSTLLVEYRGYGRSGGSPSQQALVADSLKFIQWARDKPGVDPSRVFLHGRSLGTGVAAQAAAAPAAQPAALILESPFTSVAAFANRMGVPGFLLRNPYRTDKVLPALSCPVLILHSRNDEIIPFGHAQRLKALAPAARLVELTGGHNQPMGEQDAYWDAIDALLRPLL